MLEATDLSTLKTPYRWEKKFPSGETDAFVSGGGVGRGGVSSLFPIGPPRRRAPATAACSLGAHE